MFLGAVLPIHAQYHDQMYVCVHVSADVLSSEQSIRLLAAESHLVVSHLRQCWDPNSGCKNKNCIHNC